MTLSTPSPVFTVDAPIPRVLTIRQLAGFLQISERTILDLRKAGTHRGIKQLDAPGDPRFCGRALKAWLDGQDGAPTSRHFFGKARSRQQRHARDGRAAQPSTVSPFSGQSGS